MINQYAKQALAENLHEACFYYIYRNSYMHSYRYFILLTALLITSETLSGQTTATPKEESIQNMNVLLVDPNGSPFLPDKYSSITTGSAFYKDDFLPATIYFTGNKLAKTDRARLDLLDNTIHFMNSKNEELIVSQPVEKLVFEIPDNTKEMFVHGSTLPTDNATYKKGWFRVYQQEDLTIYKLFSKSIFEYKPFNSGVLEKNIETYEKYFIIRDGALVESKKARSRK